jgi:peptidyl-Lys metalloendopeptidase
LAVDKTVVNSAERVVVKMTLANDSDHPVRILSWYAPSEELEENLFSVTRGAEEVKFVGPHYKRPAPVSDDFMTLAAGKSITREVDVTELYDFTKSADYKIQYDFSFLRTGAKESVTLSSNEVSLWIMGRKNIEHQKPTAGTTTNLAGTVTFNKCTTSQANDTTAGLATAKTYADNAVAYLNNSAPGSRYTTWFGTYLSSRWSTAKSHYAAIQDAVYNKPINFDCGCKKKYYAYVYPNQPYNIYLCSVFWTAPTSGTDSKAGTIIHEMSHFDVTAGTDDLGYGQTNAKNLALTNPDDALNNADNHEYFAENNPFLQ